MPSLKFSRDRHGYESTFLLHGTRRPGAAGQALLYWFRTPPHVKVGRSAFDQDAIRLLEEQHPDIDFDWDRILATRPPAAPEAREGRTGRGRERWSEREGRRARPARVVPGRPEPPAGQAPALPAPPEAPPAAPLVLTPPAAVAEPVVVVDAPPRRRFTRVFDSAGPVVEPDAGPAPEGEHRASTPSAVERLVGAEELTRLRARYAEVLARIAAHGGDPARVEAIREQAERVNPDAWVTETEVELGLQTLEANLAELHRVAGRRRRRRRRRASAVPGTAAASAAGGAVGDQTGDELPDNEPDDEDGTGGD